MFKKMGLDAAEESFKSSSAKASIKRSGATQMGMDGLNNAVVQGFAMPEQYVKNITTTQDGIVNKKTRMAYTSNSHLMIKELDRWGVKVRNG